MVFCELSLCETIHKEKKLLCRYVRWNIFYLLCLKYSSKSEISRGVYSELISCLMDGQNNDLSIKKS